MLPPSRSGSIAAGDAVLYTREIVAAPPWRMTTGGPDFDHGYLLPELGHLAGRFRAICYDQRGRSAASIRADDVSMATEIDDLDRFRAQFGFDTMAVLGHP